MPDILIIGKAVTTGYFPLSATLATQSVYERFRGKDQYFSHGVTHGGHPVGCAIALAAIDILLSEGLPENSARVGAYLKSGLEALMPAHPQLGEVRGYGLMLAFELVQDRQSKVPLNATAAADIALDIDMGGLLMARMGNNFILMPPLIIDEGIADEMLRIIDRALDRRFSKQVGKKSYLLKELLLAKLFP